MDHSPDAGGGRRPHVPQGLQAGPSPSRTFPRPLLLLMVLLAGLLYGPPGEAADIEVTPAKKLYTPGERITLRYAYRTSKPVQGLRVQGGVEGEAPVLDRVFRRWRPGVRRTLRFRWTPPAAGTYTLYFEVDPEGRKGVKERATIRLQVEASAAEAKPPAPGLAAPKARRVPERPRARRHPSVPAAAAARPPKVRQPMARPLAGGAEDAPAEPPANCSPDLRVDRVEIEPPHPRARQEYRIKVWALQFLPSDMSEPPESFVAIRRAGHSTAIDSKFARIARNNSAVTPDFEWTHKEWGAEELEVYVLLDHNDRVNECREDNNTFIQRYTVYAQDAPMADLAFRDHIQFPSRNLVGRDVQFSGQLVNKGNATASPFWLHFFCDDDRDERSKLTHRQRINQSMGPGEVIAFNTRIRWDNPGMKVCIVTLDPEKEVVESNENNNEYIGVTVRLDEPPPVR